MKVMVFDRTKILKGVLLVFLLTIVVALVSSQNKVIPTLNKYFTIYQGHEEKKAIALTVNVDWGQECIPGLIEILKKENVRATFFVTGKWAKQNPEKVQALVQEGNEIGNHGYYHKYHTRLSLEDSLKEIRDTENEIYKITQKRTRIFAPPYGEKEEVVIEAAYIAGYRTAFWTIDTLDWKKPTAEYIISRVKNAGLKNGSIILMHPTASTVQALPQIIKFAKASGYQILPVSEIAEGY